MKKIPKKEYKPEYTSLPGDRTYAYVVARTGQRAIDKLIEEDHAKDVKVLEELLSTRLPIWQLDRKPTS